MATFNQQNQTVRHQVNGEQVNIRTGSQSASQDVDLLLKELIQELRGGSQPRDVADAVIPQLLAARAASARGDKKRLLALLERASELAAPAAAIVAGLATAVNAVTSIR